MFFTDVQATQLDEQIRYIHQRTGVALTAIVTDRCDGYPEIPWKAFAAAIVLNGLVQLFQLLFPPAQLNPWTVPRALGFFIGTSAMVALLTIFWAPFGRFFLNRRRAEAKIRQVAQAVFLEREMQRLSERNALLMMVGLFETQAVFLATPGTADRLTPARLSPVLARMRPLLQRQAYFNAIREGLALLERTLVDAGFGPAAEMAAPPGIGLIQLQADDA